MKFDHLYLIFWFYLNSSPHLGVKIYIYIYDLKDIEVIQSGETRRQRLGLFAMSFKTEKKNIIFDEYGNKNP